MQAHEAPPWSARDSWIGAALAVLLLIAAAVIAAVLRNGNLSQMPTALLRWYLRYSKALQLSAPTAVELLPAIPVLVIVAIRGAKLGSLGFRRFDGKTLAVGCGLIAFAYMLGMIYNLIMVMLHVRTQGDVLLEILNATKSPMSYAVAAMVAAPLGEELVFRGFLFQGLRQQYGWNRAALFSSAVFAGMHLQLVALIPTFLLGYALAWVYNKSNSIWPGIILHFLVNSLAMCIVLTAIMFSGASML